MEGVSGVQMSSVYLVNLYLPSGIAFYQVPVMKGTPPAGSWDLIIGMNVISAGDFSVKNTGSSTEFSFRVPPLSYVETPEPASKGIMNWLRGLVGRRGA